MGSATQLVFPSAIFGSLILTTFAFLTNAGLSYPPAVKKTSDPITVTVQKSKVLEESPTSEAASPIEGENDQENGEVVDTTSPSVTDEAQEVEKAAEAVESPTMVEDEEADKCKVSKKYPDQIREWCGLITKFSKKNGLDADLVAALIWQESGGNPVAYSKSGAVGLMQVMPRDGIAATFMCVNGPCFTSRPSTDELQDPNFNIKYGTGMLANLVAKYGDMREALRYYGPRDVGYYYADKVLRIYENYRK